jgi:hypothetical protein
MVERTRDQTRVFDNAIEGALRMTSSPVRTRFRRGVAAGISVAVGAFGIVAVAPSAQATTGVVTYACTSTVGAFDLPVEIDTDAPARMQVGAAASLIATSMTSLPAAQAKLAYDVLNARSFDGTVAAKATVGSAAADINQAIPKTTIPDQAIATAVPFTATSAAIPFVAPATPGDVVISAGDFTASLQFYDGADAPAGGPIAVTCTAPNGKAPVIDTIVVAAKSTTTLTLSKTASKYGEDVTATAKVVTSSGAPDGDVAFSVDGVATKARVDKDGVATLVLPDAPVGNHSVTASFVPKDTAHYDGSTSAPQAWAIEKARTKMRVPVTGKRRDVVTKVGVKAAGAFGTVPTGKVKIKLKRIGKVGRWVKVRKLRDGEAKAGFGKLKVGRYRVVVKYRGDGNHLAKRKVKTFRVRR